MRERLIGFLQDKYPDSLPHGRNRDVSEIVEGDPAASPRFVGNNITGVIQRITMPKNQKSEGNSNYPYAERPAEVFGLSNKAPRATACN